jgi:hypothetical protein
MNTKTTEITKKINSNSPGVVNCVTIPFAKDAGQERFIFHPFVLKVPLAVIE